MQVTEAFDFLGGSDRLGYTDSSYVYVLQCDVATAWLHVHVCLFSWECCNGRSKHNRSNNYMGDIGYCNNGEFLNFVIDTAANTLTLQVKTRDGTLRPEEPGVCRVRGAMRLLALTQRVNSHIV